MSLKLKRIVKRFLIILFGLENFIYYKSLFKFRSLKIADKETDDFYYFLSLLKPDDNVMDIGANVGFMTILLSRKVPLGKVYSFEPVKSTFNVLKRMVNHYRLNNVSLYNIALGDENKTVTINMPIFDSFASDMGSYIKYDDFYYFDNPNVIELEVQQLCIDSMDELMNTEIHVIKMDVENYEYFVLNGSRKFLNLKRPIVYTELWYGSKNQVNVFKLMEELNYKLFVYNGTKLVPFSPSVYSKLNYFFLPAEKANSYTAL